MPKLRYFSSETSKWKEFKLGVHTRIGRHPDSTLQLLDRLISKDHAEISLTEEGLYELRDVGSRNGTLLNGDPVLTPKILADGDELTLGNHVLRYYDEDLYVDPHESLDKSSRESLERLSSDSNPRQLDKVLAGDRFIPSSKDAIPPLGNQDMPTASIRKRMGEPFLHESQIKSEERLRKDYEKLRAAAELAEEAAQASNLDALLNIIIDKAFALFKADRIAILLRDDVQSPMRTRVAVTKGHKPIHNFKISATLLDEVILDKSAVLSGDALSDQRFSGADSIIVDNVRSTMCVPLIVADEVMGVINLDTQFMTGVFTEKDLTILTGFARQAAFLLQQGLMFEKDRQNAVIRNNLRRIISPHLVDDVMSGKFELQKSGRRINSTVLFADIRGFSHMTEQNEPETIVNMLNDFFEKMVACVFRHDGALDKFVGDEVMAVWGLGVPIEDHAAQAVLCAIEMMEAVDELNRQRESMMQPCFKIGIGIASGMMIAGYMGSTQAMSYTVIGDTVNLGARLCAAAQPGEILINGDAWKGLNGRAEGMGLPPIMVKGKRDPVEVYRIMR